MTNIEKIRQMNPEELSNFIRKILSNCVANAIECTNNNCDECPLKDVGMCEWNGGRLAAWLVSDEADKSLNGAQEYFALIINDERAFDMAFAGELPISVISEKLDKLIETANKADFYIQDNLNDNPNWREPGSDELIDKIWKIKYKVVAMTGEKWKKSGYKL